MLSSMCEYTASKYKQDLYRALTDGETLYNILEQTLHNLSPPNSDLRRPQVLFSFLFDIS